MPSKPPHSSHPHAESSDPRESPGSGPPGGTGSSDTSPVVLVVASSSDRRATLGSAMKQDNLVCAFADSTDAAISLVRTRLARREAIPFQVVLVDLPACSPAALRFVRELGEQQIASVLVCPTVSFDEAVEAMRAGASDIVTSGVLPRELGRRVRSACDHLAGPASIPAAPRPRDSEQPTGKRSGRHTPRLATPDAPRAKRQRELVSTPLPAHDAAALAEQFARQIRGELDVEALLREMLEFVLAHVGPTNAAIFLPGTVGDYSLGAYVNYTCPKETAEVLLDHLANVAAPRLETTTGVLSLRGRDEILAHVGEGVEWLCEHHMLAFTCRHEGECLAVCTLFREGHSPFSPEARALMQRVAECFGAQLGRVVRIHHRHLPRDQWGMPGDPPGGGGGQPDDEGGLAA